MDIKVWLTSNWQWLLGFIVSLVGISISYLSYKKAQIQKKLKKEHYQDNRKKVSVKASGKAKVNIKQ